MKRQPLSDERKKAQSEKMKALWDEVDRYSKKYGKPRTQIFSNLEEYRKKEINMGQVKHIPEIKVFKEENKGPIDYIKLMLWVIEKVGGVKKAKKYFNAAILALEAIEEEPDERVPEVGKSSQ